VQADRRVAIHRFVTETDRYQAEVGDLAEAPTGEASVLVQMGSRALRTLRGRQRGSPGKRLARLPSRPAIRG
jgi:hypothetical protein